MEYLKYVYIIGLLVFGVWGQHHEEDVEERTNEVEEDGNWKLLYRILTDCSHKDDMSVCLKMKAVNFMNRALSKRNPLQVTDYLALAVDPSAKQEDLDESVEESQLTEAELEESLPRSLEEKSGSLDKMLQARVESFLNTRTLQFTLPTDLIEGRRKKNKGGGLLMAGGLAMAGMMAQMMMGKIALIAGKALIVAKVALVLSAVIGLKKLFSGGGGGDSHQVVYATSQEHGGGWQGRSFDGDDLDHSAHEMAYSAYTSQEKREN